MYCEAKRHNFFKLEQGSLIVTGYEESILSSPDMLRL